MKYRVDLDFIGTGNAKKAYGGELEAWSFSKIQGEKWFSNFREDILSCLGKKHMPIYRMADGEYRFLMGRKYNFKSKSIMKELIVVTAEKLRIKNPDKWETSWGEKYSPKETVSLRQSLIKQISEIAKDGYLGCYINDNGLNAGTEHNKHIQSFFKKNDIHFDAKNYIPFHFVNQLLLNDSRKAFFENKKILVVSGTNKDTEKKISNNIKKLGAYSVNFLRISSSSSMKDKIDLQVVTTPIDLCLVAAGIGSANIINQLKPLNTVIMDIGGYINCYIDTSSSQHGGVFRYPKI